MATNLNLYIGSNYIAPQTIASFEQTQQDKIRQSFFNDNEEMLAKIAAGATGYHVIVATSYAVAELAKLGKIQALDYKKLSNLTAINPKFLHLEYDPQNRYSLPYAYTPVFLAFNIQKMAALHIDTSSWAAIFDPKYLALMKGHVTVFDSRLNVLAAALLYLGKDPHTRNHDDLVQAQAVITRAATYWAKFDSDSYYRGLLRGDIWLAMSYSIDILKAMKESSSVKIGASLQREGNMIELDNLVIPVNSKQHTALAYKLVNHLLSTTSTTQLSNFTGASTVNSATFSQLPASTKQILWVYPNINHKLYIFQDTDPATRIFLNSMWTEIKMSGSCAL